MNSFSEKVNFIWSIADLIRDTFKRSKYQDVILPFTVLRRIDCVLQPTKADVLEVNARLKGKLENLAPALCRASGYAFYNTSRFDFERLLQDAPNLAANLHAYINGFSDNMREVLEKFDFNNTINRLRLNFQASPERIERLKQQKAFTDLTASKKKKTQEKLFEETEGYAQQEAILAMLKTLPETLFKDRTLFEQALDMATRDAHLKLVPSVRKAILAALSERDETAEICRDKDGNPEPDPELRDTENVPLSEDIFAFFEREVQPHVPDAWVNTAIRDPRDGAIGKVGYEINFNCYFYTYQPPRPLAAIEADIKHLQQGILTMLHEVAE